MEAASIPMSIDLTGADDDDDDIVIISPDNIPIPRPIIYVMPITFPQFEMVSANPISHRFYAKTINPANVVQFNKTVQKERIMMSKDLPPGIYVKMYETRSDLVSVMIEGPTDTPYGGCFYFFDVQFPANYPAKPPGVQYVPYWSGSIHPNMYHSGGNVHKVCLSLLGNFSTNPLENWQPKKSTLLQLVVSLQGLVLSKEPMTNLSSVQHSKASQIQHQSKMYNGQVLNHVITAMTRQIEVPPAVYKDQVLAHYRLYGFDIHSRLLSYVKTPQNAPFPLMIGSSSSLSADLQKFYTAVVDLIA